MAAPRTAHLSASGSGVVQWSDGTSFDGFLLLGLAFPSNWDGVWPWVSMGSTFPQVRLPQWVAVPIQAGSFDQITTPYFNADVEPRGCRYAAYWYDINGRRIYPTNTSARAALFDITTDPFPIIVPTLAVPGPAGDPPTPETSPLVLPAPTTDMLLPQYETPSGTIDGTNATFYMTATPKFLELYVDGNIQKVGLDYNLTGGTITFVTNSIPKAGSILLGVVTY